MLLVGRCRRCDLVFETNATVVPITVNIEGGDPFRTMPGKLVVIRCPTCGRLVDLSPLKQGRKSSGSS